MVPALTEGGRSFKGAALYYLHDKRRDGEAERLTAERVGWTATANLLTDDPDQAWRMMATTALKADELKAAAGIKATGRKMTKPAFAYSLAWHPDERPTQGDQLEAAHDTLKLLGLAEHQAIIVNHTDEPHAHVHVIVNRVHPATGKAATLSNSKLKLSEWAQAYEEQRGKVLCPARVENNAKRNRGQAVKTPRVPRHLHEAAQRQPAGAGLTAQFVRTDQAQQDAALAARGRAMQEAHRRQWEAMKQAYADSKANLHTRGDTRKRLAADTVREAHKGEWADLLRRQREEKRRFEAREKTPLGRFQNIADAIREHGWQAGTAKGVLGAVFGVAGGQRRVGFDQGQAQERLRLDRQIKAATFTAVASVRQEGRAGLDALRADYLARAEALQTQQAQERGGLRQAWRDRTAERNAAFAALKPGGGSKWDAIERTVTEAQGQDLGIARSLDRGPARD